MAHTTLDEAFLAAYSTLNKEQKKAVDTIEGPVMVVAGPGTGKTQILTLRIVNILRTTDVQPENVLALTFTESGARAMRERLRLYLGAAAYRVPIYTFHAFAGELIRAYPDAYPRIIGGRPITDLEKFELIETLLDHPEMKALRPAGYPEYYVKPIISILSRLKQDNIGPSELNVIIERQEEMLAGMERMHSKGAHKGKVKGEYSKKEKAIVKNKTLRALYQQYEAQLSQLHLYDFEDMIRTTISALEDSSDMLRDLQETYQYIHADEHQDSNGAQNRILELLASYHDHPNIFVVGDEKQAIYRFQGASLENFLYFEDVFPGTVTIALTQNYRSGQHILDLAHRLIALEEGPAAELRVPLHAAAVASSTIERRSFEHQAMEDDWLVDEVQKCIADGIPASEVAVIVRTNRDVEHIAHRLRAAKVAVTATAESDVLLHPITEAIRGMLAVLAEPSNETALFKTLHSSHWGIAPADLVRIAGARSLERPLAQIISDEALLSEIGVSDQASVLNVSNTFTSARERTLTDAPQYVLETILQASGLLEAVVATADYEAATIVRRLYDETEALVRAGAVRTLGDVVRMLNKRIEHALPLNAPAIAGHDGVVVTTAHKAKGLEFEVVFAPHLIDSVWGEGRRPQLFDIPYTHHLNLEAIDPLDDERRLFYVCLTRAKQKLYLSHADMNSEGKGSVASRLLEDLDHDLVSVTPVTDTVTTFDPIAQLGTSDVPGVSVDGLATLLHERGLSATSLNNYLRNPWDYFFRNVLRVPEIQSSHLLYGTVMHSVLESVTKYRTHQGVFPDTQEIFKWLKSEIERLPVTENEAARLTARGQESLIIYTEHLKVTLPVSTKEEFKLRVMLETGIAAVPQIPLTGLIDRLDIDDGGQAIRVVDYKTGKPKTRGQIEGTTKDSDGGYKRQLVFYALMLSLLDDDRYKTKAGVLSFIEPDRTGVVREEAFVVTDDEIDQLKSKIIDVVHEITTGAFLTDKESAAASEYARLAQRFLQ